MLGPMSKQLILLKLKSKDFYQNYFNAIIFLIKILIPKTHLINSNKITINILHMNQNPNQNINPKSSLMWNVIDPGDPYDIKKSMIARLPEHNCNFMGNNL